MHSWPMRTRAPGARAAASARCRSREADVTQPEAVCVAVGLPCTAQLESTLTSHAGYCAPYASYVLFACRGFWCVTRARQAQPRLRAAAACASVARATR